MPDAARPTRTEDAYGRLKDEILSNRMPPGSLAPEPEIALRLGMSRTPVREALIRLEAEGLVELLPRRGARILPVRAQDMREIYEILTALEPEAAAQVAGRGVSEAELAPLTEAVESMEQAIGTGNLDAWADADDRFHRTLLALHGNRRLSEFVQILCDQAHRARMVTLRLREVPVRSTSEHRRTLEYLRRGDAAAARSAFRAHRQRTSAELLALLETYRLPQL